MKSTEIGYDPGQYWVNKGEPETAQKWRTAFAAFVQGMTLKEISDSTGLVYTAVRDKASPGGDDWPSARQQLVLARVEHRVGLVDKVERQIERIQENRERNLAKALELGEVAAGIIAKLRDGTLRVEKAFNTKAGIVIQEMAPSTGDLVNIGTFLRTIADLTYRALGDAPADSKQTAASASASGTSHPAGITVILPSVAVHPRPRRQGAKQAVVEVQADVVEQPAEQAEAPVAMPPPPPPEGSPDVATT